MAIIQEMIMTRGLRRDRCGGVEDWPYRCGGFLISSFWLSVGQFPRECLPGTVHHKSMKLASSFSLVTDH